MKMFEKKKGSIGMAVAILLGVIALIVLFIVGIPIIKSSITASNLSGTDLTVANTVVTLSVVLGLAIVIGLIVYAFARK